MALVMSPWFGRGCGRRARPFGFGSPGLFTDLVIVKVPMMQRQASQGGAPAMANARIVQWAETPEGHTFKLRLPGLKKEDLQIQVEEDRTLYVSYSNQPNETAKIKDSDSAKQGEDAAAAAATADKPSQEQKISFMRKFKLPETADLEQIKAEVTNETLTVTVPKLKMKAAEPRKIEISEGVVAEKSEQ